MTEVFTAEARGYTFGCDEEWEWTDRPSLGFGSYRAPRTDVVGRHGNTPNGGDFGGAGLLSWPVEHSSGNAAEAEAAGFRLRAAFAPQTDGELVEMSVVLFSGTYIVRGRPLRPEVVTTEFGTGSGLVQFETCDPLLYASTTNSVTVSVAASSGGMVTPMATPMVTTGSGSSGDASVMNDGTAPAPWEAVLFGPLTSPRLILNGKTVLINGDIGAGSMAVVDSRTGSVLVDGVPRPWVSVSSDWWEIPPGASTFSFRASAGTGTASLYWRDASY